MTVRVLVAETGIAYYGGSKRYLRSFAACLREELRVWGVNVTCLAPGATATNLCDRSAVPVQKAVRCRVMKDPASVARAGVDLHPLQLSGWTLPRICIVVPKMMEM